MPEDVIQRDLVHLILMACNPKRLPLPETIYGIHILDVFRKSLILDDVSTPPRTYDPRQPGIMLRTASRRLASTSKKCCFGWLQSRVASVNRYLSQGRIAPVPDPAWPVDVPNIRSAAALHEAGVVFRRSKGGSMRDIQFYRGVLKLPHISVDDATEGVLLNLMAYERMHERVDERSHRCEITSLVHFMGKFVDSARDVSLLRNKGIINNLLGSDAEVVQLFSKLSKDVPLDPECGLKDTYRELGVYCGRAWPKWTAYLRHNYFYKPWAFFSVCAALLLLVLAAAQTVFAVLQYQCKK